MCLCRLAEQLNRDMRLVTWNCCRGQIAKKAPLLDTLTPDIAVVQECAKPTIESEQCLWFGENPRQGIAVLARSQFRVHRLPTKPDVPKFVFPVRVTGPEEFSLLVVWSKGGQTFPYVEAVVRAADLYRDLVGSSPTILIGDLNSNAMWDATHPPDRNHTALVAMLSQLGLVSAYHYFHREAQGQETRPTYYFQWSKGRPYHIDYCFVPSAWAAGIRSVEVGSYEDWQRHSDHRPLLVEIALNVAGLP